jgi:uncharacterized caspase-like protein
MARNPDHYAIVIGIDGYSQLRRLRASGKDATRFGLWLQSDDGGGLPPENIQVIVSPPDLPSNPFDARPVAYQVDDALTRLGLSKSGRIGKRLYFYFAGHGFGPTFDDVGMLMANAADPDRLGYNIGLRPFRLFFQQSEAFDEVIFILDCCRDPVVNADTSKPGIKPGHQGTGVAVRDFVLMAAEYGEKAFQATDKATGEPRGLLTDAILDGLKKPDAADGLGRFTASSLFDYVAKQIVKMGADPKLQQTPRVDNPKPETEIIFSTIPESQLQKVEVWISAAPGYTGNLILKDSNMKSIVSQSAVGLTKENPWKVFLLRNRWYALAHSDGLAEGPPVILKNLDQVSNPYHYTFE